MGHILVQNPGELPLWGMRLLGLSQKSDSQIGQFGTGLKESIALMTRMGLTPVIFSGTCRMDFSIQPRGGQDEICFMLSEPRDHFAADEWHGLGMHPNFGKADWDDPWMIFREVICNALDEGSPDELHHDVTSHTPEGRAGATRVYIPATSETMAAYGTVHDKLLMLSGVKAEHTHPTGVEILAKRNAKPLQVYNRGVWVQAHDAPSLRDYNFSNLRLNESRSSDWFHVNTQMHPAIHDPPLSLAKELLLHEIQRDANYREVFEVRLCGIAAITATTQTAATWREAFHELFGPKAVVTGNEKHMYERIAQSGHKPIIVMNSGLRDLLKAAGCPSGNTVLSHQDKAYRTVEEPPADLRDTFNDVWNHLSALGFTLGKAKPALKVFEPVDAGGAITFGEYADGTCYINKQALGSRLARLACLEEIAHHLSGEGDFTRGFQNWLFDALDTSLSSRKDIPA